MTIETVIPLMGPALTVILTSGVVAAIVTFFQNRWLENRRAQEVERTRLRQSFAEAFATYSEYKEFPYAIRRRRGDQKPDERARLSAELNTIQSKLNYYRAWTQFESPSVGKAYADLLSEMRRIAGAAMHEAWVDAVSTGDSGMNISLEEVDLRALTDFEDRYIAAVTTRLSALTPWSLRRK